MWQSAGNIITPSFWVNFSDLTAIWAPENPWNPWGNVCHVDPQYHSIGDERIIFIHSFIQSINLSINQSINLSIYLSIYLSTYQPYPKHIAMTFPVAGRTVFQMAMPHVVPEPHVVPMGPEVFPHGFIVPRRFKGVNYRWMVYLCLFHGESQSKMEDDWR